MGDAPEEPQRVTPPPPVSARATPLKTLAPVPSLFGGWIRDASGCLFARRTSGTGIRVVEIGEQGEEVDQLAVESIEYEIRSAAEENLIAAICLPHLEGESAVLNLLRLLRDRPCWTVTCVDSVLKPGAVDIRVGFRCDREREDGCDEVASVMGAGPLWSMPATRRAPYVGLVVYAGGRKQNGLFNAKANQPIEDIGLVDAPLIEATTTGQKPLADLKTDMHKRAKALFEGRDFEGRRSVHSMTFRLMPADCGDLLASSAAP